MITHMEQSFMNPMELLGLARKRPTESASAMSLALRLLQQFLMMLSSYDVPNRGSYQQILNQRQHYLERVKDLVKLQLYDEAVNLVAIVCYEADEVKTMLDDAMRGEWQNASEKLAQATDDVID
jgi:hypothetical protein